jgi:dihydroorotase
MKILIKKSIIIDQTSEFNLKSKDILIVNGVITKIEDEIVNEKIDDVLESANQHVSVGWFDMAVNYKDPGHEWLESLETLHDAASRGGFTEIAGFPNTSPTVQTKESIAYFSNFSKNKAVKFHNYAAVTKNCEGKDFTDMIDLHTNGAVGFSDGCHSIQSSDILLKTLQYLKPLNAILLNKPEDKYLSLFGQIHEGIVSTKLGLKGIPSAAEELMIMRDIKLLEYADLQSENSILHFSAISTKESVKLIRKAKEKGLAVSCDIAAHQLAFTDGDVANFDSNFKVKPPFRAKEDIKALIAGLKDGTIDTITSDHNPLDAELKNLEFDLAEFGVIGLQTTFGVANTYSTLTISDIIAKFTTTPRKLLRMQMPILEIGAKANLTVFDPTVEYVIEENQIVSKSKNSPFIGKKLKGKALAIINNNSLLSFI